jgi:hypothetical protein
MSKGYINENGVEVFSYRGNKFAKCDLGYYILGESRFGEYFPGLAAIKREIDQRIRDDHKPFDACG